MSLRRFAALSISGLLPSPFLAVAATCSTNSLSLPSPPSSSACSPSSATDGAGFWPLCFFATLVRRTSGVSSGASSGAMTVTSHVFSSIGEESSSPVSVMTCQRLGAYGGGDLVRKRGLSKHSRCTESGRTIIQQDGILGNFGLPSLNLALVKSTIADG